MEEMPKRRVRRKFEFISEGPGDLMEALGLMLQFGTHTKYWVKVDDTGFHVSLHRLGNDWASRPDLTYRLVREVGGWLDGLMLSQRDALSATDPGNGNVYGWRMFIELTEDDREIITIVPHPVYPIPRQQLVGAGHMSDQ
ncbi:MAG TPA: hypothetical protein VLE72_01380 [Candidatus Saccharimonadales bacterium]|nr:hypothetical protein [Candidatus Saccharimonadales bacterium]